MHCKVFPLRNSLAIKVMQIILMLSVYNFDTTGRIYKTNTSNLSFIIVIIYIVTQQILKEYE